MRAWACIFALAAFAATGAAAQAPDCRGAVIAAGHVARIADGRTFFLDDGREVRLAGLDVPPGPGSGAELAQQALAALVLGRDVSLLAGQSADVSADRYGRLVAYASVDAQKSVQEKTVREKSVQDEMLAAGVARVSSHAGACARSLQSVEEQARRSGRGLWNNADFRPVQANQGPVLQDAKGRFALVEGRILSVRESGAVIYLNFGRRRDFSVTILKRNQRVFSSAGLTPKQLEGKTIRVRGIIEQRTGPVVEAARPEQIELVN